MVSLLHARFYKDSKQWDKPNLWQNPKIVIPTTEMVVELQHCNNNLNNKTFEQLATVALYKADEKAIIDAFWWNNRKKLFQSRNVIAKSGYPGGCGIPNSSEATF